MPNLSQKPAASSKAQNEDLKDMDVLYTFKIKTESQNLKYGPTKDQCPYPNQCQDAKPQSGTSRVLQSPKSGLKGHGCSLHLQNQSREPKFRRRVYQRPVIKSKMPNPSQEPPASSKTPDQDLNDMDILCILIFILIWPIVFWAWEDAGGS